MPGICEKFRNSQSGFSEQIKKLAILTCICEFLQYFLAKIKKLAGYFLAKIKKLTGWIFDKLLFKKKLRVYHGPITVQEICQQPITQLKSVL